MRRETGLSLLAFSRKLRHAESQGGNNDALSRFAVFGCVRRRPVDLRARRSGPESDAEIRGNPEHHAPRGLSQGFAIHESSTISTVFPAAPCFNNLVQFDPAKAIESTDTIVGDLAEKWSWQDNYSNLVFFLRKNVKWHDGHPFSSKDVKFTFDMLREGPDAPAKLRINPRKDW